jgi:hypothetical protein
MTDQASADGPTRRTRRQLLAGGTGPWRRWSPPRPSPGLPRRRRWRHVILGQANLETAETTITNTTDGGFVLICDATGSGTGLTSSADSGDGVRGISNTGFGVRGQTASSSASGVHREQCRGR